MSCHMKWIHTGNWQIIRKSSKSLIVYEVAKGEIRRYFLSTSENFPAVDPNTSLYKSWDSAEAVALQQL